jgi:hypothetical protein
VASIRSVEQALLVRLQAGAGRSGNAKRLIPHRLEEMVMEVSLCDLSRKKKETNENRFYLKDSPSSRSLFSLLVCGFLLLVAVSSSAQPLQGS